MTQFRAATAALAARLARSLSARFASLKFEPLVVAAACGVAATYVFMLISAERQHLWIVDDRGHPVVNDFVVFWAVGHMALKGMAVAAYNARIEHAAELATIGHKFKELLGWSYPPPFLFVVMLLAVLPYRLSFLLWGAVGLSFQAGVVAAIARRRAAFFCACAMPWVPVVLIVGQNGLLTAALVGFALLHLEKRPALGGLAIGLLSCKPQFGVLIPLALMTGGYWRAFLWAAASTVAFYLAAGAAFGAGIFEAFLHALSTAAGSHLVRSDLGWNKLQSTYGLLRYLGAPGAIAWSMQGLMCAVAALAVALCWRNRNIPYPLKAAILASAIPLATPYILYYDVPVLAVAAAFVLRHRMFDKVELAAIAPAWLWLFAPFVTNVPSAFPVIVLMNVLVLRRLVEHAASQSGERSWAGLFDLDLHPAASDAFGARAIEPRGAEALRRSG